VSVFIDGTDLAVFRPMPIFGLILVLSLLLEPSASWAMSCRAALGRSSNSYTELVGSFHKDMLNIDQAIEKLKLNTLDMPPEKVLGKGFSGWVLKVKIEGKYYALKLFRPILHPNPEDFRAKREGVIIQRILGDLNIAPKVVGILDDIQTKKYVSTFRRSLEKMYNFEFHDYNFGLLMELTNTISLKNSATTAGKIYLPKEQKQQLYKEGDRIAERLVDLGIKGYDMDITVTSEGRLMLFDIGFYEYPGPDPANRKWNLAFMKEAIKELIGSIKELKKAN
jgi:hypothetical protein